MGDKTEKEKHKKELQHDAKRLAAEHDKQKTTEAQHHLYRAILPPLNTQPLPGPSK
jgi:hypothetical protein